MPQGYSSLGGQVLLAVRHQQERRRILGRARRTAVATGLAPLAGRHGDDDRKRAQLIAPAGNAGVVGLKPTVGLISRTGEMPVAKSQDSPGPIGQTVSDVATALNVLAGPDPSDPATAGSRARCRTTRRAFRPLR